nr:hypothetical protein [Tanacetum cinerariifolium]
MDSSFLEISGFFFKDIDIGFLNHEKRKKGDQTEQTEADSTSEAQLLISSHGHGGHSVSLTTYNQSSITAIRVVAEPYVQDAPTKHATTFKRNDEVLSLGRNIGCKSDAQRMIWKPYQTILICSEALAVLIEMDLFAFIHTLDPTKVNIFEWERIKDEPLLLQNTIGRTVSLLLVVLDCADSELETSIDRLFNEGGSGSQAGQGGSACVREGTNIQPVTEATRIFTEDVAPLQPRRQRKRKTIVADAGGSLRPPRKLREDHGTLSEPSETDNSRSAVYRLLVGAVLNVEVRGEPILTFPFVTSSVSAMPELEGGDHTDFVTGLNVTPPNWVAVSSVPMMTDVTITTSMVDHAIVVKEKTVKPSLFAADSSLVSGVDPNVGVFWILLDVTFLAARQMSLSGEVRMHAKYNIKENRRLKFVVKEKDVLLKARDKEIENLKAHVALKEAKAVEAIRLCAVASNFMTVEMSLWHEVNVVTKHNTILEKERDALVVKVADLEASMVITECEITNLSAQLTSIKSHNDSLIDQMSLSGEVRMHAKYNIKENRRLKFAVEEKDKLLKARDKEIENLKAHVALKKAKAVEAIRLCAVASNFMTVEMSLRHEVNVVTEHNTILEKERDALVVKVAD